MKNDNKNVQGLDLNPSPRMLETTALSNGSHSLPYNHIFSTRTQKSTYYNCKVKVCLFAKAGVLLLHTRNKTSVLICKRKWEKIWISQEYKNGLLFISFNVRNSQHWGKDHSNLTRLDLTKENLFLFVCRQAVELQSNKTRDQMYSNISSNGECYLQQRINFKLRLVVVVVQARIPLMSTDSF